MARAVGLRLVIWGAFLALGLVAVAWTGLPTGAPGGVFATAQAIAREGVPTIGGNTMLVGPLDAAARGLAYRAGNYWDIHPPAAALLAVPAAWIGVPLADALHAPGAAVLLVALTGVLLLLLAAAALAWAGERMGMPPASALLAAALAFAALLWPVGTFTDTTVLVALTGVLLALLLADGADARVDRELGWTPRGRLTMTGFVLGFLPFAAWFGVLPLVALSLTLVAWGRRQWWRRVGWLLLGAAPPLIAYVAIMTAWFGSPFASARQGGIGEAWARSLDGLYRATPSFAAHVTGDALLQLIARHPLLVVGWLGLLVGLWFMPWRTRISVLVLLVTLGVPALYERQLPGGVAEEHPIAALASFAAAGYLLLIALIIRDRLRFLPAAFALGAGLIGVGAVVSGTARGVTRPALVPVEANPAVFLAPIGLCVAVLLLLAVPALEAPRARTRQLWLSGAIAVLLLPLLMGCGSVVPGSPRVVTGVDIGPNLLPPFGTRAVTGVTEAVWTLSGKAQLAPDGTAIVVTEAGGGADSPRVPVQVGDRYRIALRVLGAPGGTAGSRVRAVWLNVAGNAVGEVTVPLVLGANTRALAAAPDATALRLTVTLPAGVAVSEARLTPLDGGRLDLWPDYQRAALAFSFDWETAMGGLIHTRGGTKEHDVADAEARGLQMRTGAQFLRRTFDAYNLKATWYVNGYNFLTGNTAHRQFAGNPTYARYNVANAGFLTDYWTTHPWYGDDPYGTETTNPAWYFGSLTKDWLADGQDIESHTFGHLFLASGITPQQLDDDLTTWDTLARENNVPPAHSFAFPWGSSNKLTDEYYAVFAKHGITNVTRFYDAKPGTYEIVTVPQHPSIRVMPDTQLISGGEQETITRRGDEMMAERGIDLTLASGGAWSLWTHPESVTTAAAQAMWGRVIGYAADHRKEGLWVAPATTIMNFAAARDTVRVTGFHIGEQTTITAMNEGTAPVVGATITLPHTPQRVTYTGGNGAPDQREAQVRLGTLGAGQQLTFMVSGP